MLAFIKVQFQNCHHLSLSSWNSGLGRNQWRLSDRDPSLDVLLPFSSQSKEPLLWQEIYIFIPFK